MATRQVPGFGAKLQPPCPIECLIQQWLEETCISEWHPPHLPRLPRCSRRAAWQIFRYRGVVAAYTWVIDVLRDWTLLAPEEVPAAG